MHRLESIIIRATPNKKPGMVAGYVDIGFPINIAGCEVMIKIKSFQILKSQYAVANQREYKVSPPAIRMGNGKYNPIFFLEDTALWNRLEERVINELKIELRKEELKNPPQSP